MTTSKYGLSDRNRRMLLLRGKKDTTGTAAAAITGSPSKRNNYRVMMDSMKKERPGEIQNTECSDTTRSFIKGVS